MRAASNPKQERHFYSFDAFRLYVARRELFREAALVPLTPKALDALFVLVSHHGHIVDKDELIGTLWPDTFVEEASLVQQISHLRKALGERPDGGPYIETAARRGYRFAAPVTESWDEEPAEPRVTVVGERPAFRRGWTAALAAGAVVLAAVLGIGLWQARDHGATASLPRVVRLTAFAGAETHPAFSPDGTQVAFTWNGERQDNYDIYVKMVGSETALRLTRDPSADGYPAWSPDGRQIAFVSSRGQSGIYLVSPLGGSERKLLDVAAVGQPSWSPDGRFLVVSRTYNERGGEPDNGAVLLIPVEGGGEPRRILTPQPGRWYEQPAFSPDGRQLAVASCAGAGQSGGEACQLQIVALNAELLPEGKSRVMTDPVLSPAGMAWTGDGDSLLASALTVGGSLPSSERYLWRIPVRKAGVPQRLEAAAGASYPAINSKSHRLAFVRNTANSHIWRWEPGGKPSALLVSSLSDFSPQFSHDGRRIAFESSRSGDEMAIWVANADGAAWAQITRGVSWRNGTPRWSPDDLWIAFDAREKNGRWNVWVVEASGGPARRLTYGPADSAVPSWSKDGKWVYLYSNRSGQTEIWRVPAQGGPAEQITRRGGYVAFESTDGKTLYYTKSESGAEGLFAIPITGGEERQVFTDRVSQRGFAVFTDGIYYLSLQEKKSHNYAQNGLQAFADCICYPSLQGQNSEIRFHEFASGRSRRIAEIEGPLQLGLSVSPDRKTFLFTRVFSAFDLMLMENFR